MEHSEASLITQQKPLSRSTAERTCLIKLNIWWYFTKGNFNVTLNAKPRHEKMFALKKILSKQSPSTQEIDVFLRSRSAVISG